jgi:hypothetical protein
VNQALRTALAIAALALGACAPPLVPAPDAPPPALVEEVAFLPVPEWVDEVVSRWGDLIKVTVRVQFCGVDNAWYTLATDTVTLCSDMFDRPELVRFVLNHELAHALVDQHGLPWIDYEFAADELAFMFSHDDEVYAAVAWFLEDPGPGSEVHPPDIDRAAALLCLQAGYDGTDRMCAAYYRSAVGAWLRAIRRG